MKSKIGQLANTDDNLGLRDAVHITVVIVQASDYMLPCANVRFIDDEYKKVELCDIENRHSIVDPFIQGVDVDYNFLMLLTPGSTRIRKRLAKLLAKEIKNLSTLK